MIEQRPGWVLKLSKNCTKICIPWRLVVALVVDYFPSSWTLSKQRVYSIGSMCTFDIWDALTLMVTKWWPDVKLIKSQAFKSVPQPRSLQLEEVFSHEPQHGSDQQGIMWSAMPLQLAIWESSDTTVQLILAPGPCWLMHLGAFTCHPCLFVVRPFDIYPVKRKVHTQDRAACILEDVDP